MKRIRISAAAILAAILVGGMLSAQSPEETPGASRLATSFPAPSAVRGSQFPRLNADGTVTFQVTAPDAERVQIVPRGTGNGLGDEPLDMTRGERGVWSVTAPVRPGFHYYQIAVDGFRGNDPASQTYFGWAQETSGLEAHDPQLDFYARQDVPHGDVRIVTYDSRVSGGPRRAFVYTPPGYDDERALRYPVLYLQHGAGESERAWTEQGKAHLILDNLIAAGRAKPMLVVMENGYATRPDEQPGRGQADRFAELVVSELVPLIDGRFRTLADRDQRAIAGLSMGGGQAMRTGLGNLDQFAWIGTFSGAIRDFDLETSFGGALRDAEEANRQLRLLWIGCGTEDRLIEPARQLHAALTEHNVKHVWFEGAGSHEWQVWRKHLHDFAPRLFQGAK
jgi:enterochelin esterase-like enzyme